MRAWLTCKDMFYDLYLLIQLPDRHAWQYYIRNILLSLRPDFTSSSRSNWEKLHSLFCSLLTNLRDNRQKLPIKMPSPSHDWDAKGCQAESIRCHASYLLWKKQSDYSRWLPARTEKRVWRQKGREGHTCGSRWWCFCEASAEQQRFKRLLSCHRQQPKLACDYFKIPCKTPTQVHKVESVQLPRLFLLLHFFQALEIIIIPYDNVIIISVLLPLSGMKRLLWLCITITFLQI